MVLGKGHRPGVKPAVDNLGNPMHGLTALGTGDEYIVDKRTMQLDFAVFFLIHLFSILFCHIRIVCTHGL